MLDFQALKPRIEAYHLHLLMDLSTLFTCPVALNPRRCLAPAAPASPSMLLRSFTSISRHITSEQHIHMLNISIYPRLLRAVLHL